MSRFWQAGASSSSEDDKGSDSDSYDQQPAKQVSGAKFGMTYDSDSGMYYRQLFVKWSTFYLFCF